MATYCEDTDLLVYRNDILTLGVSSWETQRLEAFAIINRVIIVRWYNKAAQSMGADPTFTLFDPTKVMNDDLKRLEIFKTLELAFVQLAKATPDPDGFERFRKMFKTMYGEELDSVLGMGLTYDWSGDGEVDQDEYMIQAPRRLSRC